MFVNLNVFISCVSWVYGDKPKWKINFKYETLYFYTVVAKEKIY